MLEDREESFDYSRAARRLCGQFHVESVSELGDDFSPAAVEAAGALRKAQDVIHSKNLAPGTKMYVYDKSADKYDVYEVGTDGAWKGADKVTINTDGKATFDTVDLTRGVTAGTGVPSVLTLLATRQEKHPRDISTLKGIITMGSPLEKEACSGSLTGPARPWEAACSAAGWNGRC